MRVVTPDVGGAFGMKLSAYPDEMAVAAIAVLLGRPVKFCADRLESFVSDNHAREAKVHGRLAVDADGHLMAMEVSVVSGFGAYTNYPRGSVGEALQAVHMSAAPYRLPNFRGRARGYFQNKSPSGILRAVGQPIACTVTEQLLDLAARKLNIDPAEIRRRNYATDARRARAAGGIVLGQLSLDRCHERLLKLMDYESLRHQQPELRGRRIYRGIGLAAFIEQTAVGPALYGPQQVRVSADEACRLTLSPDGGIRCATSITDQGQGTRTALVQIVAQEIGVDPDTSRSSAEIPAARRSAAAPGRHAARRSAGKPHCARPAAEAEYPDNRRRAAAGGGVGAAHQGRGDRQRGRAGANEPRRHGGGSFYRSHTIPLDELPALEIVESFAPRGMPYIAANGIQAAHVEVDPELGTIRVLDFWVVEDCGRVINPLLVDEQIRGGVVQGIGAALYEQCIYSKDGQLENGSLVDYLVPMAGEMPDIRIAHVETPTSATSLGARGVGEAGTVGAAAAIWTAVNDALSPFGTTVTSQPFTPEHVLDRIAGSTG